MYRIVDSVGLYFRRTGGDKNYERYENYEKVEKIFSNAFSRINGKYISAGEYICGRKRRFGFGICRTA